MMSVLVHTVLEAWSQTLVSASSAFEVYIGCGCLSLLLSTDQTVSERSLSNDSATYSVRPAVRNECA